MGFYKTTGVQQEVRFYKIVDRYFGELVDEILEKIHYYPELYTLKDKIGQNPYINLFFQVYTSTTHFKPCNEFPFDVTLNYQEISTDPEKCKDYLFDTFIGTIREALKLHYDTFKKNPAKSDNINPIYRIHLTATYRGQEVYYVSRPWLIGLSSKEIKHLYGGAGLEMPIYDKILIPNGSVSGSKSFTINEQFI